MFTSGHLTYEYDQSFPVCVVLYCSLIHFTFELHLFCPPLKNCPAVLVAVAVGDIWSDADWETTTLKVLKEGSRRQRRRRQRRH